jgi:hypothetical protein
MKVKETVTHADGTTTEREFVMEMSKGRSHVSWTLGVNDEPIAVRILESGWRNMYHVITEYGDYEESVYSHLSKEELLEKYPIFQKILDQMFQDIVVTETVIKSIPNDATLGKHVRKESISR